MNCDHDNFTINISIFDHERPTKRIKPSPIWNPVIVDPAKDMVHDMLSNIPKSVSKPFIVKQWCQDELRDRLCGSNSTPEAEVVKAEPSIPPVPKMRRGEEISRNVKHYSKQASKFNPSHYFEVCID